MRSGDSRASARCARSRIDVVVLVILEAGLSAACSSILGLSEYNVQSSPDAASPGVVDAQDDVVEANPTIALEASAEAAVAPSREAGCDAGGACYGCPPATQVQFLNACTSSMCVPFDDTKRLTHLLPDGALPPLPPLAAGEAGTP